ncbi:tryptophan/tyrosine permease, partial [Gammaproteobacteria bacterium]|nr:tryptophan/tyrosine permease [Gammaproteobacteria bacterium]
MYKKAVGSVLMILGTSVGAGMIALPVVTAYQNFYVSLLLLVFAWFLMTVGAFSLLEVNLWLPSRTNMISMAEKTIGKFGKSITWIVYLLLLYSLICAYLSGLGDIIQSLLMNVSISIPRWSATILGLSLFGLIVYRGISSVDIVNRGFMSIKLIAYILLVMLIAKNININFALDGDYNWHSGAFMIMLTSFGYAIVVPTLREYLETNLNILKKVILIGSLIPLIIYTFWIFVVQGVITRYGDNGLIHMLNSSESNSLLMNNISHVSNILWVPGIAKLFISICAVTSFLGVSICLSDFLSDGIKIEKKGRPALIIYSITYIPPLIIVLIFPGIFITALDYAGILCLILLILIPLCMLY